MHSGMRHDLVSPLFVGRETELATMTTALESAVAGTPTVVLLGGEAGVGKTRLVEEAAERAHAAGARVLAGSCIELGGEGLPFGPLAHAFRTLMRDTPPDELDALLGPARPEFARVLPDLDPDAALSTAPLAEGGTARLLELALGVIERLAEDRPLMFVIEDLHWADRSTIDLVAPLVRALPPGLVLVVVSFRTGEVHRSHPLRPLVTGWERVRTVHRIELERFGREDVERQLAAILGASPAARLVDLVHERSEGNAFLVEEILGAVQSGADPDQLPLSLRDVLLARVERLSPVAQRLLRVAAAAGPSVSDRLLAAVAGLGDHELDDALREGLEHHVLVADGTAGGYVFRHALTRDAVYGDTLARERARIHAAYGEALAADPALAGSDVGVPALLALHWSAAHDLPRALAAFVEAGGLAAAYAPAEALRHLERALELWPQVPDADERSGMDIAEVLKLAGLSACAAGALDRSLALLDEALAELGPAGDVERRAIVLEARSATLTDLGREHEALAVCEEAAALLPPEPFTHAHAVVLTSLAGARWLVAGDPEGGLVAAAHAVAAARAVGARGEEANAEITLGGATAYRGDLEQGIARQRAGIELAEAAGDERVALRGYLNLSDALEMVGRHTEAEELTARGLEMATRIGLTRHIYGALLVTNRGESLTSLGRWAEAEELLTAGIELGLAGTSDVALRQQRGRIRAWRGRHDEAAKDLDTVIRLASPEVEQYAISAAFSNAELLRGTGRLQEARAYVRDTLEAHPEFWRERYRWTLVWIGLRIESEAAETDADRVAALVAEA